MKSVKWLSLFGLLLLPLNFLAAIITGFMYAGDKAARTDMMKDFLIPLGVAGIVVLVPCMIIYMIARRRVKEGNTQSPAVLAVVLAVTLIVGAVSAVAVRNSYQDEELPNGAETSDLDSLYR